MGRREDDVTEEISRPGPDGVDYREEPAVGTQVPIAEWPSRSHSICPSFEPL